MGITVCVYKFFLYGVPYGGLYLVALTSWKDDIDLFSSIQLLPSFLDGSTKIARCVDK